MKIYMVYDKANGGWYKRSHGDSWCWTSQEDASVWTKKQGPVAAIVAVVKSFALTESQTIPACADEWKTPEPEIVTLTTQALPKIDVVDVDNYTGLYLDGCLSQTGYNLGAVRLLESLGIPFKIHHIDRDWFYSEATTLPHHLCDVELQ